MKWIISNHKDALDDKNLTNYIEKLNSLDTNLNLVICPTSKHLSYFNSSNYNLGSQDISRDITIETLKENNVKYTIVGHIDTRKKYFETDEEINKKIKELLKNNICPILCIGEEKNSNLEEVLKTELEGALKDINERIIIAYEPIWAINTGIIPDVDSLKEIINYINNLATNLLKQDPIILYGGSVNEETIEKLNQVKNLDGFLIGSASLDIERLEKLIEKVNK